MKELAFVGRARVIGSGPGHIMWRHILPNVMNLIVANTVLVFGGSILTETTLSFIGLGDPFAPSWGQVLNAAESAGAMGLGAWWYRRPAVGLHRPRRPGLHPRRLGPRRRPQPPPEGPPMTEPGRSVRATAVDEDADAAAEATRAAARRPGRRRLDAQALIRGPAPVAAAQAGRPERAAARRRAPDDPVQDGRRRDQGGRRRQLHPATTARRWGSPANPAAARRRPPCRSSGCCRPTAGSARTAASSSSGSTSPRSPRTPCGATAGARSRSSSRAR